MAKRMGGLSRGLDYLFSDNGVGENAVTEIRISEIEPNRAQPRRQFDEAALEELAESIRKVGLLQPITVRPMANLGYQIVAGERRWRACRMAGLETVPVLVLLVPLRFLGGRLPLFLRMPPEYPL